MKLSLVVPCYNEQDNVEPFFGLCRKAFSDAGIGFEAVFVDDGSTDGTLTELKKLYSENENVRVISFSRNFGKEAAMLCGMKNASGEYISIIDADLQQRPETVCEMVKILDEKPDCDCVAAYQEKRSESAFMVMCKKAFYRTINRTADVKLRADTSDFRTFRRNVAEAVMSLPEYSRFSKGLFSWVGFNTEYIPYVAEKRNSGKSAWSFKKLIRYSETGITDFSVSPLRAALYAGAVLTVLAAVFMIVCLAVGWGIGTAFLLGAVALALGIQLIFTGIIGVYLSKLWIQSKNRPVYIEKLNLKK